jgi:AcrR family transcriptional regulator
MTAASVIGCADSTVKARLIRAADTEVAACGTNAVQMEAIAKRAGVSRATAFRQLGSIAEVLVQVALLRSQRHIAALQQLMDNKTGAFAKIEAALACSARTADRSLDRGPDRRPLSIGARPAGASGVNEPSWPRPTGRAATRRDSH